MTHQNTVLVVDDEQEIREGVKRWLTASGFDATTAGNGEEGFMLAAATTPNAIVLDMLMPRQDGMETLAELRTHEVTKHIPVVVLSASMRDQQRALDAGAKFFVQKPFDGRKLVAIVRTAIEQQCPADIS